MKSKPMTMTQPEDWIQAFKDQAKEEGMSLSKWIGECCLPNLPPGVVKKLSGRPEARRPTWREEQARKKKEAWQCECGHDCKPHQFRCPKCKVYRP